ncbi:MAG: hypothetical protein NZ874_04075 [Fimbriimonadales bacterium]|nr:hypothetical protein [Fimbriimonadales bacterium]
MRSRGFLETPSGWIFAAIVCLIVSLATLWVAIVTIREADEQGMVIVETRGMGKGRYPAHFFFSCPAVFGLGTVVCFYMAWKLSQE